MQWSIHASVVLMCCIELRRECRCVHVRPCLRALVFGKRSAPVIGPLLYYQEHCHAILPLHIMIATRTLVELLSGER
jgi:hypothetical protein